MDSECIICKRVYLYNRRAGHTRQKCNSCSANQRRFTLKQKCLDYKGGKCQNCSYDRCSRALSFHHLDPSTKLFSISGSHCRTWEVIKQELDKCILLCANCHMEMHGPVA